jgi:hypothetical protein
MSGRAISTTTSGPMRTPTLTAIRAAEVSRACSSAVQALEHAIESVDKIAAADRPLRTARRHCCKLLRDLPYAIEKLRGIDLRVLVNRIYKPIGVHAEYGRNWWARYENWPHLHFTLKGEQKAAVVRPGAWKSLFFDGEGLWTGRSCFVAHLLRLRVLHPLISGGRVAELPQGGRGAGR